MNKCKIMKGIPSVSRRKFKSTVGKTSKKPLKQLKKIIG